MIVTLGCSFTYNRLPSKVTPWPNLVQKHLKTHGKMQLVNLANNGVGNRYMLRNMVQAYSIYKDKIKVFFVGLSQWDRFELGHRSYDGLGHTTNHYRPNILSKRRLFLDRNGYFFHNDKFIIDNALNEIILMQTFCKNKNIKLVLGQLLYPSHQFTKKPLDVKEDPEFDRLNPPMQTKEEIEEVQDYYKNNSLKEIVDWVSFINEERDLKAESLFPVSKDKKKTLSSYEESIYSKFYIGSKYSLGYHSWQEEGMDQYSDYTKKYDVHPNKYGHSFLAKKFYEKYIELYYND